MEGGGLRVDGLGSKMQGQGFRFEGLRLRVWD